MSKVNKLGNQVPPTESDFVIDVEGNITKKRYIGEFTSKILNKKDQAMVAKHRAYLNGDMVSNLDPLILRFHMKISYLRYALVGYPKWWKELDLGYEIYDGNVVDEVYERVLDAEETWLKTIWGEEMVEELKKEDQDDDAGEAGPGYVKQD